MLTLMRILGIDPALGTSGWGVIDVNGQNSTFVSGGVIRTNAKDSDSVRLKTIHDGLRQIIDQFNPTHMAVEETFVNSNARTSLKLGQARGVPLLVAALYGLEIGEYAPSQIKKALVGTGRGDKEQVQYMVKTLLPTACFSTLDTADALAVAICHAHTLKYNEKVA